MPESPSVPSITAALDGAEQQLKTWTRARDVLLAARDVEQLALEAPDRASTFKTLKETAEREYAQALKRRDEAVAAAAAAEATTQQQIAENRIQLAKALDDSHAALEKSTRQLQAALAEVDTRLERARITAEAELARLHTETETAKQQLAEVTAKLDAIKASLA